MKKLISVILVILVLSTLCGCRGNNAETLTETVSEISESTIAETTAAEEKVTTTSAAKIVPTETTSATATVTEREYMQGEECLLSVLAYLQEYSIIGFAQYDFLNDFKVDGYSYEHIGDGVYNVELTCSDSVCELFPNGKSYWYFDGERFCRFEEKDSVIIDNDIYRNYLNVPEYETMTTAFCAACTFSFSTDLYEADEAWFSSVHSDVNTHWLYHSPNPYMTFYEDGGVYPDEFHAAVKKLYNITLSDFNYITDENGRIFAYCAHGGTWRFQALAGYEETDGEVKVTVNHYGDELYFYPVIQSEYTFSKNDDGSVTLQNVRKIFDRNYEVAQDTI